MESAPTVQPSQTFHVWLVLIGCSFDLQGPSEEADAAGVFQVLQVLQEPEAVHVFSDLPGIFTHQKKRSRRKSAAPSQLLYPLHRQTCPYACFLSLSPLSPEMPRPPSPSTPLSDDESLIPDVADLAQLHFGSLQKRAKKVSDFRSNHVWSSVPSRTASSFFFVLFFFCTQKFYVIICSSAEGSRCFAAAGNGTKSRNPVKVI